MKTSLCTHVSEAAPIGRSIVSKAARHSGGGWRRAGAAWPPLAAASASFGGVIESLLPFGGTGFRNTYIYLRLDGGPAPVDGEDLAGHVAARVARQVQQRAVELALAAVAPHRRAAGDPLVAALLGEHVLGHLALEPARGDRVDPDPLARPLRAELAGQVDDPALRRGVARLRDLADAAQAEDRGDVDDRAALGGVEHRARGALGERERRDEVHGEHLAEALDRLVEGGLGGDPAGGGGQPVGPAAAVAWGSHDG